MLRSWSLGRSGPRAIYDTDADKWARTVYKANTTAELVGRNVSL